MRSEKLTVLEHRCESNALPFSAKGIEALQLRAEFRIPLRRSRLSGNADASKNV